MTSHARIAVGDTLPELEIPITRTLIVATALASRDYQDVHHDPDLAVERGSPDVFMNILTTNGLVERFVTGWAGPAAVVEAIRIRLGAPNHPGDTMTLSGTVTARHDEASRPSTTGPSTTGPSTTVEVAVRGVNRLGAHVTGTVVVRLPAGRNAEEDRR